MATNVFIPLNNIRAAGGSGHDRKGPLYEAQMMAAGAAGIASFQALMATQNLTNAKSTGSTPGEEAYRRKLTVIKPGIDKQTNVLMPQVAQVIEDNSEQPLEYNPVHPAANAEGYVKMPNVTSPIEMADLMEATKNHQASLKAYEISVSMTNTIIEGMKR